MPLRTGKEYLIPYLCINKYCKFYGTDATDLKCSNCFHEKSLALGPSIPRYETDSEFRVELENWVNKRLINTCRKSILLGIAKKGNLSLLDKVLKIFGNNHQNWQDEKPAWINAKFALELMQALPIGRHIHNWKPSHIICKHILDWWNITVKNNFHSFEICYWGKFQDSGLLPHLVPPKNLPIYPPLSYY
mgnify:FL=1